MLVAIFINNHQHILQYEKDRKYDYIKLINEEENDEVVNDSNSTLNDDRSITRYNLQRLLSKILANLSNTSKLQRATVIATIYEELPSNLHHSSDTIVETYLDMLFHKM